MPAAYHQSQLRQPWPRTLPGFCSLYNGRVRNEEHARVFPISNWTELDVWQHITEEDLEVPSTHFAPDRVALALQMRRTDAAKSRAATLGWGRS